MSTLFLVQVGVTFVAANMVSVLGMASYRAMLMVKELEQDSYA